MNMGGCISEPRRGKRWRYFLCLALLGLTATTATGASKSVRDVRYWSVGEVTRVAIEVSAEFSFKTDRIENPDRLFFDILDATPGMIESGTHIIAVDDAVLKQIRVASNQPNVTRVVLDLKDGVEATTSQLSNPARLMVELRLRDGGVPSKPPEVSREAAPQPVPQTSVAAAPPVAAAPAPAASIATTAPPTVAAPPRESSTEAPALVRREDLTPIETAPAREPGSPAPERDAGAAPRVAARNSNGDRSITRVLGLKIGRVVIDPGHGGKDVGTHGKSGVLEKDIALDISKRLAHLLQEDMGSEVILTRTDDTFVGLEQRTKIANDSRADLFISVHVNSSPIKSVAGVDVYFLNFSASREDLDIATRENATTDRTIYDLEKVVSEIALRAKIDESREVAIQLQHSLQAMAKQRNPQSKDRGIKRAPFVVLIGAEMPSVLAEIGFLSNAKDEELLRSPQHRQQIAEALYEGIRSYAETLSGSEVAERE